MKVAIAWGRCNPMTIGHGILFKCLHTLSQQGYDTYAFVTQTRDTPTEYRKIVKLGSNASPEAVASILRNPLPWEKKVKFLSKIYKKRYPELNISTDSSIHTLADVLEYLNKNEGYTEFAIVAGEDRIPDYQSALERFRDNDELALTFTSYHIFPVGDRDPDSEGVEGMSATKMRQFSVANDFESFKKGLDTTDGALAKEIFDATKVGMTVPPEYFIKKKPVSKPKKLKESYSYLGTCVELGSVIDLDPTDFAYMIEEGSIISKQEFMQLVEALPYPELGKLLSPDIEYGKYSSPGGDFIWAYNPDEDIHYIWG